jgi:hypothetical protein
MDPLAIACAGSELIDLRLVDRYPTGRAERLTNIILDGFKRNFGHGVNLAVTGNTSRPGRHSKALNLTRTSTDLNSERL